MMKKVLKNQRGLTLIELLAVIVILGIIAAIAVPAIGNVIDKTKDKAIVSEAIQIINGAKIAKVETPGKESFTQAELEGYVDNVDLKNVAENGFTVSIDNKGIYSITGHDAVTIVKNTDGNADSSSEAELIAFTK